MSSGSPMEVVSGICKVILPDNSSYLLVVNQALLDSDPAQSEALFQPHQLHAHGAIVDETAACHRGINGHCGCQMIKVGNVFLSLYFDGWKTFLSICKPNDAELSSLTRLELTSPLHYEPQEHVTTHHHTINLDKENLLAWHECLGFPTLEVTRQTLLNTMQSGYNKFQMFSFCNCKVDIGKLIRCESQAIGELQDIIREVGAPT
jgi:hypothetical protein